MFKNNASIHEEVARITGGKRTAMKAVLSAIENQFKDIALIAVDTKQDAVLFGFEYLDEQERIHGSG